MDSKDNDTSNKEEKPLKNAAKAEPLPDKGMRRVIDSLDGFVNYHILTGHHHDAPKQFFCQKAG